MKRKVFLCLAVEARVGQIALENEEAEFSCM